jgi:hypothetical protein
VAAQVFARPSAVPGDLAGGDGSETDPFRSVQAALTEVHARGGGTVLLFGGHFVESVELVGVVGSSGTDPIVVRPVDGTGEVVIDSCLTEFLSAGQWVPVDGWPGEYCSIGSYPAPGTELERGTANLGAFYDEPAHTRLVSYAELDDLRSTNQYWPGDVGHLVWRAKPNTPGVYIHEDRANRPHRRSFVYMGPGVWFDRRAAGRRVHVRLGPTALGLPNWPDFDPAETDPNRVRLALSVEGKRALFLTRCRHIRFEDLTLRFGNPETVRLKECTDIAFDHCRIRSGSRAISMAAELGRTTEDVRIEHCEIDGGLPTWFFRSDRKDTYLRGPDHKEEATEDEVFEHKLGYATSGVQVSGDARCHNVLVHHCEIVNAHDSYVFGTGMRFHHNWVHNLNDDGIAVSGEARTEDAEIYCNVLTQCLTALSFAASEAVGPVRVYGNLIDVRRPTLAKRPTSAGSGPADSLKHGHFFKDGADEGEISLFHNTCLVRDPGALGDDAGNDAGFAYFVTIGEGEHPRTAFNNIMVAVFAPGTVKPTAFLAPSSFATESDGNTWFRLPQDHPSPRFLVRRRRSGPTDESRTFPDLADYRLHYWPAGGGYEVASTSTDPVFASFDYATGAPHPRDDLRLRHHPPSPARGGAVELPALLRDMYVAATGVEPTDRGCYPPTGERLRVGVDGRRVFPRIGT